MKQLPLYEQIYNDIIEGIENGTYKKGDRLPSEKELSEKYCVSRITSKKRWSCWRRRAGLSGWQEKVPLFPERS